MGLGIDQQEIAKAITNKSTLFILYPSKHSIQINNDFSIFVKFQTTTPFYT